MLLLINCYVQVWYANVRSLLARVGHVSKHEILLLSGCGGCMNGGGLAGRISIQI